MTKEKLNERQRVFLQALHTSEYRMAPPGTLGPTIVGLWNRGLIEGRLVAGYRDARSYAQAYEWRLK